MANVCMDCEKEISTGARRCKSCSVRARKRSDYISLLPLPPTLCSECGAVKLSHAGNLCQKCGWEARNVTMRNNRQRIGPPPNKYCLDCGKKISQKAERCRVCSYKHRPQRPQTHKKCRECGGSVGSGHETLYCVVCAEKLGVTVSGGYRWRDEERRLSWRSGEFLESYGPGFNNALKLQVRTRDGFRCLLCGTPENGGAFACHHIDYDKKNNAPSNLATLCKSCHSKTNFNREYWQAYFTGEGYHLMLGAC